MPAAAVQTKFFQFHQNNSGGSYRTSKRLACHVVIEAINAAHANQIAEDLGIYFDGVSQGTDCSCCGDRWYSASGEGDDAPKYYDKPISEVMHHWSGNVGEPVAYVHYIDGNKTSYLKANKE